MTEILHFLDSHGTMLIIGASALLVVGGTALLLHRAPINRQRAGELTIATVLAWMLLACIPLPRWSTSELLPHTPPPTIVTQHPHESPTANPPFPVAIDQEQLADEAARIHEKAEILAQLAQLDAEQAVLPPVEIDLPPGDSPPTRDTTVAVAVAAAPLIEKSSGAAVEGFSWRQIVVALYLGGAALCATWIALGWLLLFRLTRLAISPHGWLRELYTSLSSEPLPRLLVSSKCRRAFSCGWWRPTIVLPLECCEESRAEQLRQILLHELAHLGQGDQRGRVLFNIALPVLYVHPLYWWIRSRTYLAAELVADDWAAGHSSTTAYAGELIALVKEQGRRGMAHVGTVGIFSSPTQFYRRMEMLVRRQTPLMTTCTRRWRLLTTLTATIAVVLLSSTLGVRLVQAEPDDGEKKADAVETSAVEATDAAPSNDTKQRANVTAGADEDAVSDERPAAGIRKGNVRRNRRNRRSLGVDDDDPFTDSGRRGSGSGLLRLGVGARNQTPQELLPAIKSLRRDVLIMRLQLINRRVTDKEQQIRKLLTEENATDEQVVGLLYKNVLKRPANEAETALVQQILKLSDNRGDSIRRVLESIGEMDDAMNAALNVMRLETQLDEVEAQVQATMVEAKSLPADLFSVLDMPAEAGKTLKSAKHLKKNIDSWHDLASLVVSNHNWLLREVRSMSKTMAELAKLDKELQKQQANSSRYWYGTPKTPSTTAKPPAGNSWYAQTQKPPTGATPPNRGNRTVIKRVPVRVERKTPDGRSVYETHYVEQQVVVPENDGTPYNKPVPKENSKNVDSYAPAPQLDAPAYNAPRPATNESRRTPRRPNQRTRSVSATEPRIEPVPDSRLPSTHHDVIKLATDYSQTHSELDSAKRAYERIQKLKKNNAISQEEYEKAAEKLASMRERLKTMQSIAEILRESIQAEMEAVQIEMHQAAKTKDEVRKAQLRAYYTRAIGNLKILKTMN